MIMDFVAKLAEITKESVPAALCILTETEGSTPRKAGSKMIVTMDGRIYGTIGGGSMEQRVIQEARMACNRSLPVKLKYNLDDDLQMQCGGFVEVYIEPIGLPLHLVIFGAGHVGSALGHYARDFGFKVSFVDSRAEFAKKQEQLGFSVILGDFVEEGKKIISNDRTFFVVVTPQHSFDQEITAILAKKPFAYLGMIGSKRKIADAKQYFIENNLLTPAEIARIDMPIGIKFNAETPEEIAISILARLIDVKNSH